MCGSLRDRLRKSIYSIWGTSSEGAYHMILFSACCPSSVTNSNLIVAGTAASGRNHTRRICSGRLGKQMLIRRKNCQLHLCSGTAVTITCWTRPTIIPLPGEWLNIPTSTGEIIIHHLSLIFSVHLSSCDPQLDKILCVCSCGTLEKIYASAA